MPYIPVKAQESQSQPQPQTAYVPGAKSEAVCNSGQNLNQVGFSLSPELQSIVDAKAKELGVGKENTATFNSEELPVASEADFQWLRGEVERRIKDSERFDFCLSFEQRGQLYRYREELRSLPDRVGERWAPQTIVWPQLPNISAT